MERADPTNADEVWPRCVVVLGAGASCEAGVPLANQFVSEIRYYIGRLQPPETRAALLKEHRRIVCMLGGPADTELEEWQKELKLGLEPYYEAIDDALEAHFGESLQPERRALSERITSVNRATERLLFEARRVIQLHTNLKADASRQTYIDKVLERITHHGRASIVSFNYDNLVELRCASLGIGYTEPALEEEPGAASIELVKVHGSITWFQDEGGKLRRDDTRAGTVFTGRKSAQSHTNRRPMIYPTRHKLPIRSAFLKGAVRTQRLWLENEWCVVIGYSFPDAHVRSWLADAMEANARLKLILIDPAPAGTIDNLTRNLPRINWTARLRALPRPIGEVSGLELDNIARVSTGLQDLTSKQISWAGPTCRPAGRRIYEGRCSHLAASLDGRSLFLADAKAGTVSRIAISDGHIFPARRVAEGLLQPRGIAEMGDGKLWIVENQLPRLQLGGKVGMGRVVELDLRTGRKQPVTRVRREEIISAASDLRSGKPTSEIWHRMPSVLRWPKDILRTESGRVYATEARALIAFSQRKKGDFARHQYDGLAFNLQALDATEDGELVAIEEGVSQGNSWGRLVRLSSTEHGVHAQFAKEGYPRLGDVCYLPGHSKVLVSQNNSWPHGCLLVFNYPGLQFETKIDGLDHPRHLAYLKRLNMLAISNAEGIDIFPLPEPPAQEASTTKTAQ